MSDADLILCEMLVLRCQRRDPSAAEELVAFFEKPLLYYLRRLVRSEDDAWDLFQETWISIFRTLLGLRDPRTLPAFLYRTARNHALARLRHREVDFRLYAALDPSDGSTEPEPTYLRRCCRGSRRPGQTLPAALRGPDALLSSRPDHQRDRRGARHSAGHCQIAFAPRQEKPQSSPFGRS